MKYGSSSSTGMKMEWLALIKRPFSRLITSGSESRLPKSKYAYGARSTCTYKYVYCLYSNEIPNIPFSHAMYLGLIRFSEF